MATSFTIYQYAAGDTTFLYDVINAVAALTQSPAFVATSRIGAIVAVLFLAFRGMFNGSSSIDLNSLFVGFILYGIVFAATATVNIQGTDGSVRTVANVPIGVAAIGSATTTFGFEMTELFEQAFAAPTMTQSGFDSDLETLKTVRVNSFDRYDLQAADDPAGVKASFSESWSNYIQTCTIGGTIDPAADPAQAINTILAADNLPVSLENTNPNRYPLLNITGTPDDSNNCAAAFALLYAWTTGTFLPAYEQKVLAPVLGITSATPAADVETKVDNAFTDYGIATPNDVSDMAATFILDGLLSEIFQQSQFEQFSATFQQTYATEVQNAMQEEASQWAAQNKLFQTMVNPFLTFVEAFLFAVTPFFGALLLTGVFSAAFIRMLIQAHLWVALWMPLMAIVNYFIFHQVSSDFAGLSVALSSMNGIVKGDEVLLNNLSVAQYMATAVPGLAGVIAFASAQGLQSVFGRLQAGATAAVDPRIAAPEWVASQPIIGTESLYHFGQAAGLTRTGFDTNLPTFSYRAHTGSSVSSSMEQAQATSMQWSNSFQRSLSSAIHDGRVSRVSDLFGGVERMTGTKTESYLASHANEAGVTTDSDSGSRDFVDLSGKLGGNMTGAVGASIGSGANGTRSGPGASGSFGISADAGISKTTQAIHGTESRESSAARSSTTQNTDFQKGLEHALMEDFSRANENSLGTENTLGNTQDLSRQAQTAVRAERGYREAVENSRESGVDQSITASNAVTAISTNAAAAEALDQGIRGLGLYGAVERFYARHGAQWSQALGGGQLGDSRAFVLAQLATLQGMNPFAQGDTSPPAGGRQEAYDAVMSRAFGMGDSNHSSIRSAQENRRSGVLAGEDAATRNVVDSSVTVPLASASRLSNEGSSITGAAQGPSHGDLIERAFTNISPAAQAGQNADVDLNQREQKRIAAGVADDMTVNRSVGAKVLEGTGEVADRTLGQWTAASRTKAFQERYDAGLASGLGRDNAVLIGLGGVSGGTSLPVYQEYRDRLLAQEGPANLARLESLSTKSLDDIRRQDAFGEIIAAGGYDRLRAADDSFKEAPPRDVMDSLTVSSDEVLSTGNNFVPMPEDIPIVQNNRSRPRVIEIDK